MRHRKKFNHLGRTSSHRKAMLSNMATSLILHKRITTTLAKAKALRSYIEPLITRSKEDTTHSRRMVFSYLQSKEAVAELFREVSIKVAKRPGGYTRIIKMENRLGDNAQMCFIELVDFNELLLGAEKETAKAAGKRRRRRGGGKPKTDQPKVEETVVAETATEKVAEESADVVVEEVVAEEVVEEKVAETVAEDVTGEAAEEVVAEPTLTEKVVEETTEEVVAETVAEEITEEVKEDEPEKEDDDKEKKAE